MYGMGGIFDVFGQKQPGMMGTRMVNTTAGQQPLAAMKAAEARHPGTEYMMSGDVTDANGVSMFNPLQTPWATDKDIQEYD